MEMHNWKSAPRINLDAVGVSMDKNIAEFISKPSESIQPSQPSERSAMSANKPSLPSNRPSLPSKLIPNRAGRCFYVPLVIGGVPMSFLYDTGANLTYIDQGTVDSYGLQSFVHHCRYKEGKGIKVTTVSGTAMNSTLDGCDGTADFSLA
jgi:hypothetical protein